MRHTQLRRASARCTARPTWWHHPRLIAVRALRFRSRRLRRPWRRQRRWSAGFALAGFLDQYFDPADVEYFFKSFDKSSSGRKIAVPMTGMPCASMPNPPITGAWSKLADQLGGGSHLGCVLRRVDGQRCARSRLSLAPGGAHGVSAPWGQHAVTAVVWCGIQACRRRSGARRGGCRATVPTSPFSRPAALCNEPASFATGMGQWGVERGAVARGPQWLFDLSNTTAPPLVFSISYSDNENTVDLEYCVASPLDCILRLPMVHGACWQEDRPECAAGTLHV
jgi:hypothetical protein